MLEKGLELFLHKHIMTFFPLVRHDMQLVPFLFFSTRPKDSEAC